MESRYESLVSIRYKHAYFSNREFDRISTQPTHDTQEILIRNGLWVRYSPAGCRILFDSRWGGRDRERMDVLKDTSVLLFQLSLNDPDFYNYTAVEPGDITRSFVYLSNVSPGGEQHPAPDPQPAAASQQPAATAWTPAPGLLHSGETVTENDSVCFGKLPSGISGKPFGWLQLILDPSLKDSYEARWPVRSVYWNYIVVSRQLRELNRPAIIDTVTQQAFTGPEEILLPDNRPALSFLSATPISFQAAEKKIFQLVENYGNGTGKYRVVLSALPRADTRVISTVRGREKISPPATTYYSEIFIY